MLCGQSTFRGNVCIFQPGFGCTNFQFQNSCEEYTSQTECETGHCMWEEGECEDPQAAGILLLKQKNIEILNTDNLNSITKTSHKFLPFNSTISQILFIIISVFSFFLSLIIILFLIQTTCNKTRNDNNLHIPFEPLNDVQE